MHVLTEHEIKLRTNRRKSFRSFLRGVNPALIEFAEFIGVENPASVLEQPDGFLKVVDFFLKNENIDQLDQESKQTLHLMLMYFIGQLCIHRYGGIWFLNEDPGSAYFLRYVVGYFDDEDIPKNRNIDPFEIAKNYMESPPERSLVNSIEKALDSDLLTG